MNYDEKLKLILNCIKARKRLEGQDTLPEIPKEELYDIIEDLYRNGFINCRWSTGPINRYKGGALIDDNLSVSLKGHQFMDGVPDNPTIGQQINIDGGVHGSNIGNNGKVTNNYSADISDLKKLLESITDITDQKEASEMVQILEKEPIKPGLLNRFDRLLGKYPNLAEATGKLLVTIATTTGFIQPPL